MATELGMLRGVRRTATSTGYLPRTTPRHRPTRIRRFPPRCHAQHRCHDHINSHRCSSSTTMPSSSSSSSSSSPASSTPISNLSNHELAQLEEEQHLGKQLSRLSSRAFQHQSSWSDAVRNEHLVTSNLRSWLSPTAATPPIGIQHFNSAKYEHDGLSEIHARSFDANVLLEIRDARVPGSCHHPSFTRLARHRTHLICYTHADLIDAPARERVERWTDRMWPDSKSIFVDTRHEQKSNDTLHYFDVLYDGLLHNVMQRGNNIALTVGVANVGKSSVLMSLLRLAKQRGLLPSKGIKINVPKNHKTKSRGKARLQRGSMPGIHDAPGKTREITEYVLRVKPRAYFMDVPGITPPPYYFEERPEAWYGFGATNLTPLLKGGAHDVEMHKKFCHYVLHCANRDGIFQYVDKFHMDGPTNDVDDVLCRLSNRYRGKLGEDSDELWLKRCETFLKLFNTGNFGPLVLDDMEDWDWTPFSFRDEHFTKSYGRSSRAEAVPREDSPREWNSDELEWNSDDLRGGSNGRFSSRGPRVVPENRGRRSYERRGGNDHWRDDEKHWSNSQSQRRGGRGAQNHKQRGGDDDDWRDDGEWSNDQSESHGRWHQKSYKQRHYDNERRDDDEWSHSQSESGGHRSSRRKGDDWRDDDPWFNSP